MKKNRTPKPREARHPTPKLGEKFKTELKNSISKIDGVSSVTNVNDAVLRVKAHDDEYLVHASVALRYKEGVPTPEEFGRWLEENKKSLADCERMTHMDACSFNCYLKPIGHKEYRKMPYSVWFTLHVEVTGRKPYEQK